MRPSGSRSSRPYIAAPACSLDEPTAVLTPRRSDCSPCCASCWSKVRRPAPAAAHGDRHAQARRVPGGGRPAVVMQRGGSWRSFPAADFPPASWLAPWSAASSFPSPARPSQPRAYRRGRGRKRVWSDADCRAAGRPPTLELRDHRRSPRRRRAGARGVLAVPAGMIYGIAGVEGNGQSELCAAIAGLLRPPGRQVQLGGRDMSTASVGARKTSRSGFPEDHSGTAWCSISLAENLMLGTRRTTAPAGSASYRPAAVAADRAGAVANVRCASCGPEVAGAGAVRRQPAKAALARAL